ncbi:hypothetical protein G3O06_07210 [Burkholderia sp. Ac-20345]|uniref:hypothetical protein n=1 Tax=Burkholderia sp. Ac-20345 TaxID=2703891 RepID=UPI00197C6CCF|nr:hypothetical protein [Burkholderia sp. Ac-20345]MBN3777343.1 hypothetical protein [Burkholderia sp. Ac-20345]
MQHYSQRVRDNILPLSIGDTLPKAFEEWTVTESVVDHETPRETCELCGQESLRYQFEIRNSLTGNTLWVGSQCILKFGLSVFENGRILSPEDAKKKINRIMEQMRQDACIRALEAVAIAEENEILSNALQYFKVHKYLSPKQAFVVLWRLNRHRIDHNPSFFKIDLKHDRFKSQLREMEESRVHVLWPALTSSQRKLAERYGHHPPAS